MNNKFLNKVLHGNCLELSNEIESGTVDLILTDLPYGTMVRSDETHKKMFGDIDKWDVSIEPKKVHEMGNRILRKNGKMVLFSQEPYTTNLINNSIPNLPFSYRAIWEKDSFANPLGVNKAMVGFYEDILIFNKKECYVAIHPLREEMLKYVDKYGKEFIIQLFLKEGRYTSELSARVHASYKFGFNNGMRFDLMDESMFAYLSNNISFKETYEELKYIDNEHKRKYSSTFNLWEGKKYKSNILKHKKDYDGFHPTQKPVSLLEDLIKTFSNESDTVVDLTSGSGSTAVACINTNRNFICIENDWNYCKIANERIKQAKELKLHSE